MYSCSASRGRRSRPSRIFSKPAKSPRGTATGPRVLRNAGEALEAEQNIFETGEIAAGNSDAAEGFEESGEQRAGFGRGFFGESVQGELVELFWKLIGPKRFEGGGAIAK